MRNSASAAAAKVESEMGDAWLPQIYRDRILKMRTRSYEFPPLPKKITPQIHHSLLGIELKVGRRRMLCPDLATARYLSVFARVGCRAVAIPYDITRISQVADELESSWHRMLLLADESTRQWPDALRARVRRKLISKLREELETSGAGPLAPEFARSTKQRER
jgi:hypothetical protein